IVYPEKDMGERIARNLMSSNIIDFLRVGSNVSIIEIKTPEIMVGKSLMELNLRNKYGVTIISIKNKNNEIITPPDVNYKFKKDDVLTLIGEDNLLKKLHFTED
ncbi:MAG: TrkA C-terminal domain-containing protein, partial [Candidatus Humimicrobiaceae bacterium]|nr:TrkA C-terminal domain-containing protein [Candidatus Humimicrobiaceae bacterium]